MLYAKLIHIYILEYNSYFKLTGRFLCMLDVRCRIKPDIINEM